MSEVITPNGSETLVNPVVEDDQNQPAIAGLTNGNYVVAYETYDQTLSRYLIDFAIHAPDGTQIASGLNGFVDYALNDPDVAATEDGGFLVAFVVEDSESGLYVAKYAADGTFEGVDWALETDIANGERVDRPSIEALPGGGYAVTYGTGSGSPIEVILSDADTGGSLQTVEIEDGFFVNYDYPMDEKFRVATLDADKIVVVVSNDSGIALAIVKKSGETWIRNDSQSVQDFSSPDGQVPSVAALDDGNFVVTWQEYDAGSSRVSIYSRVFDSDGAPVTGEMAVDVEFDNDEYDADVAAIDGGYIVTWRAADAPNDAIVSRTFDNDGTPRGDVTTVSTSETFDQVVPQVAGLANGGFAFAWESRGQDNPGEEASGIYTQAYTYQPALDIDAEVVSVTLSSTDLAVGEDLDIDMIVTNNGTDDWSDSYSVVYWSSSDTFDIATAIEIDREGHSTLNAGEVDDNESVRLRYEDLVGLGDGNIFVVIDGDNAVDETNEANNVSGPYAITVDGGDGGGGGGGDPDGADLSIVSMTARDSSLAQGQKLKLDLTVANTGDVDAAAVQTTFYWSADATFDEGVDVVVGTDGHGKLTAGEVDDNEREKIKFSDLQALGEGFIFAKIDAGDAIDESDEGNNVSGPIAFTLPAPADLSIVSMTARDTTLEEGQKLKLDLTVTNTGETKARGVETSFYWSANDSLDIGVDTLIGTDGHGKLNAGEVDSNERFRLSYDEIAALGDGYIIAMIDAVGEHAESDESNNVSTAIEIDIL